MSRPGVRRRIPRRALERPRWRPNWISLGAALVAWIGLGVLLYPAAASWSSQVEQSRIVTTYTAEASAGVDPPAAEQIRLAHKYNDALTSGAVLEANQRLPTGKGTTTNAGLDYDQLLRLDAAGVMARVQIPAIGVDLPVYHGTSDDTLMKGIGHLQGTSLPVGGVDSHAVLTGHRGLATAAMFTDLNLVKTGDSFTISVFDVVLTYKVVTIEVVDPDQTESLRPVAGKDLVTLVTCTPLGINSQRILVTGERVSPTPATDVAAARAQPQAGFPWWAAWFGAGTLLIWLYAWRSGYPPRRRRTKAAPVRGVSAVLAASPTG
jgi:sortase A